MVKDDNNVDSTQDIDTPPIIGGVQLKYDDPVEYQETEKSEPDSNDAEEENTSSVFKIIGIVAILYGIIVGVFILMGTIQVDAESFFIGFVLTIGVILLFVVPGVICIGISRIINLLAK